MPPGMLQQMQRQMRGGGGGVQEMLKAMMQGQGSDPAEMEEMQRVYLPLFWRVHSNHVGIITVGMMAQMGSGLGGLGGLGGGMPDMGNLMKMMGGMGGGAGGR
jgi:signal recognition particle subunit SRP54